MSKFLSLVLLLLAMLLSGCATTGADSGKKDDVEPTSAKQKRSESKGASSSSVDVAEQAEKFIARDTTYRDVVRALGKPTRTTMFKDGRWVDYEIEEGDKKGKTLHLRFDRFDVLYLKAFN